MGGGGTRCLCSDEMLVIQLVGWETGFDGFVGLMWTIVSAALVRSEALGYGPDDIVILQLVVGVDWGLS